MGTDEIEDDKEGQPLLVSADDDSSTAAEQSILLVLSSLDARATMGEPEESPGTPQAFSLQALDDLLIEPQSAMVNALDALAQGHDGEAAITATVIGDRAADGQNLPAGAADPFTIRVFFGESDDWDGPESV